MNCQFCVVPGYAHVVVSLPSELWVFNCIWVFDWLLTKKQFFKYVHWSSAPAIDRNKFPFFQNVNRLSVIADVIDSKISKFPFFVSFEPHWIPHTYTWSQVALTCYFLKYIVYHYLTRSENHSFGRFVDGWKNFLLFFETR